MKAALGNLAAALVAVCVVLAAYLFGLSSYTKLDHAMYDWFMVREGVQPVHPVPVIIDIDEKSLAALGQWPWSRSVMAELVKKLTDAGVAAIGLDILQSEADRSSPLALREDIAARYGVTLDLSMLPDAALDNDAHYRDVITGRPVVLGAFALFGSGSIPDVLPKPTGLAEKTPPDAPRPMDTVPAADGVLLPMTLFSDVAPIGTINAGLGGDGIIRTVPLLTRVNSNIYASLSLRSLMMGLGKKTLKLESNLDGLADVSVGDIHIPVTSHGEIMPRYRGPAKTYPYFSVADVLSGAVGKAQLQGRIAFVGSSATGLLDIRATPFDPVIPGVEIHATLLDNILTGDAIKHFPYTLGLQVLATIAAGLLAFVLFGLLPAVVYGPLTVALMGGTIYGSWRLFEHNWYLSPVCVLAVTALTAMLILPLRFWREQKGRRELKQAFSRYVSPEIVSRIAAQGGVPLTGEQKDVTVLFTDIRGFSTLAEQLEPGQIITLLNRYFTPMTACVKEREGTMDKFIGDALMAFWNAPLDVKGHPLKAVQAAMAMHAQLAILDKEFQRDFGVSIRIGAGIHTGPVYVGNMGSAELLDYTCLGDTVNLASRLEGLTKKYDVGIVVSSDTAKACELAAAQDPKNALFFRQLDIIRVKGKTKPVSIYTPITSDQAQTQHLDLAHNAMDAYAQGEFDKAERLFTILAENWPQDATLASLYIERCRTLAAKPPTDWDGVWSFDSK